MPKKHSPVKIISDFTFLLSLIYNFCLIPLHGSGHIMRQSLQRDLFLFSAPLPPPLHFVSTLPSCQTRRSTEEESYSFVPKPDDLTQTILSNPTGLGIGNPPYFGKHALLDFTVSSKMGKNSSYNFPPSSFFLWKINESPP